MLERKRLPCREVMDVLEEERDVVHKVLGFALTGDDRQYRGGSPDGLGSNDDGARAGRHDDPTGEGWVEFTVPAIEENA
jgi:hypothetical protein